MTRNDNLEISVLDHNYLKLLLRRIVSRNDRQLRFSLIKVFHTAVVHHYLDNDQKLRELASLLADYERDLNITDRYRVHRYLTKIISRTHRNNQQIFGRNSEVQRKLIDDIRNLAGVTNTVFGKYIQTDDGTPGDVIPKMYSILDEYHARYTTLSSDVIRCATDVTVDGQNVGTCNLDIVIKDRVIRDNV